MVDERFKKSKAAWDICEQKVIEYIVNNLWWEILETAPDKRFKDWDIKALINWVVVTYEVKSDRKSEHTPNSYIEYSYKVWNKDKHKREREDSWILWTNADYFVMYSDRKRRQQEVEELRNRLNAREKRSVVWWDDNRTKWWLFRHAEMPSLFDQIEEMEELPPFEDEEIEQKECVGG